MSPEEVGISPLLDRQASVEDSPGVTEPIDPSAQPESVYLRIEASGPPAKDRVVATLIEIDPEGYIPREIGIADDGTPI